MSIPGCEMLQKISSEYNMQRDYRGRERDVNRGNPRGRYDSYASGSKASASEPTKKTYWSGTPTRVKTVGDKSLDTIIVGSLTTEQVTAYQQYFRIEEISDIIRAVSVGRRNILSLLPSGDSSNSQLKRDPSPPPKYDSHGTRTNTREIRVKESMEKERQFLVEKAISAIKDYTVPPDYTRPLKTQEKIFIPVKDYPDINFIGFLIGPRGKTLRNLEDESGAKLHIRGKGSSKEGKSTFREDRGEASSADDDLHVLIIADTQQKISIAIRLVNEIIEKLIMSPEHQNDTKREQLRELAVLNGTLRETKPFDATRHNNNRPAFDITNIVCKICGNVGHLSRDCKLKGSANANLIPLPEKSSNGQPEVPVEQEEDIPPWKKQKTDSTKQPSPSAPPAPITVVPVGAPPPAVQLPPEPVAVKPPPPSGVKPPPPVAKPPPPVAKPPPPVVKPQPPAAKPPPPPPKKEAPPPPQNKPPPPSK